MAIRLQVRNVLRDAGRLTHIAGRNADREGTPWRVTVEEAIRHIRSGTLEFYVAGGGSETSVIVATNGSVEYLRTESDDTENNNLSSLPELEAAAIS